MDRETWHGTLGGYTNHRCHCPSCTTTWRAYYREYRAKGRKARESSDAGPIIGSKAGPAGNRTLTATTVRES